VVENQVGCSELYRGARGRIVISLPGVPREMKFLLAEKIVPYHERYNLGVIKAHVLHSAGIGSAGRID
jgi:molybdopterin-biosynthesis enzyme MoeA-like protein